MACGVHGDDVQLPLEAAEWPRSDRNRHPNKVAVVLEPFRDELFEVVHESPSAACRARPFDFLSHAAAADLPIRPAASERLIVPLTMRGENPTNVFRLLGADENSATFALGWTLDRSPNLLARVVTTIFGSTLDFNRCGRRPPEARSRPGLHRHGDTVGAGLPCRP